jgi:hypothetical protein
LKIDISEIFGFLVRLFRRFEAEQENDQKRRRSGLRSWLVQSPGKNRESDDAELFAGLLARDIARGRDD